MSHVSEMGRRSAYRSRMKRIRSLAKSPKLDKHEKPKSARVKKNTPEGVVPDQSDVAEL